MSDRQLQQPAEEDSYNAGPVVNASTLPKPEEPVPFKHESESESQPEHQPELQPESARAMPQPEAHPANPVQAEE